MEAGVTGDEDMTPSNLELGQNGQGFDEGPASACHAQTVLRSCMYAKECHACMQGVPVPVNRAGRALQHSTTGRGRPHIKYSLFLYRKIW